MKVLLHDFRWRDNNSCEFSAIANDKLGKKIVKIGDKISLQKVNDTKKCVGSVYENQWKMCPQNAIGKQKCELCRSRERSFIFTVFDGFDRSNISDADLQKIANPHVVYLAFFDGELIKIGVSNSDRKTLRQLEQAAHFTLFVAETKDGIEARQIETILRRSGIADKIKITQKRNFLLPEISATEGEGILRKFWEKKRLVLTDFEKLKNQILTTPEFQEWQKFYGTDQVKNSSKSHHSIENFQKNEYVSGKILAIKGPFLMIDVGEEIVSICTKELLGYEIDFSEKPIGINLNSAFQKSLF
jgi:hypothetical protein